MIMVSVSKPSTSQHAHDRKRQQYCVHPQFYCSRLAQAISSANSQQLLSAIEDGEDIHAKDPHTGFSYLHLIMMTVKGKLETPFVPMIYQMSTAGINLDVTDNTRSTALHLAISNMLLELMVALLKVGAKADPDVDRELIKKHTHFFSYEFFNWYDKLVPGYWDAVDENNAFRVNKLVKSWCRINVSRNGLSLTEYARQTCSDVGIVRTLVSQEATIDCAHSVLAGDARRMCVLMCDGSVDLTTADHSYRRNVYEPPRPLSLREGALLYEHKHILSLLDKNYPVYSEPGRKDNSSEKNRTVRAFDIDTLEMPNLYLKSVICSIS